MCERLRDIGTRLRGYRFPFKRICKDAGLRSKV